MVFRSFCGRFAQTGEPAAPRGLCLRWHRQIRSKAIPGRRITPKETNAYGENAAGKDGDILLFRGRKSRMSPSGTAVEKSEPAISRVLSRAIIHLRRLSPAVSSDLPGSPLGTGGADEPRAPLFGLAPGGVYRAASCYQSRGALLPHLFTLTDAARRRRYLFCGTFHGLTPPRRYLAPCPKEPGLSSPSPWLTAVVWPTPAFSDLEFYRNCACRTCQIPACAVTQLSGLR